MIKLVNIIQLTQMKSTEYKNPNIDVFVIVVSAIQELVSTPHKQQNKAANERNKEVKTCI